MIAVGVVVVGLIVLYWVSWRVLYRCGLTRRRSDGNESGH